MCIRDSPDTEILAVAAHHRNDRALTDRGCSIHDRFGRGHHHIEEELFCLRQETDDFRLFPLRDVQRGDRRRHLLEEHQGSGDIPLVELIAHADRLADQCVEGQAVRHGLERLIERRAERVADKAQAFDAVSYTHLDVYKRQVQCSRFDLVADVQFVFVLDLFLCKSGGRATERSDKHHERQQHGK